MKYKVGDKLKRTNNKCGNYSSYAGEYIIITEGGDNYYTYDIYNKDNKKRSSCASCLGDEDLEFYNKLIMSANKLTPMQEKTLDKDMKVLVEAGYLDSNLEVTEDGKRVLESMVFEAHKVELIKLAKAAIKSAKEEVE